MCHHRCVRYEYRPARHDKAISHRYSLGNPFDSLSINLHSVDDMLCTLQNLIKPPVLSQWLEERGEEELDSYNYLVWRGGSIALHCESQPYEMSIHGRCTVNRVV